ncbi:MAG TPA: pyridoxal-dependent decarboxylase [Gemmatimonadales bacterium]|nr:pyridoxal-dependent decarboxylase [Gemmatimonadales bacterium]
MSEPSRADILALERAARALEPGTSRRKALRNAIAASGERFLRRIGTAKAWEEPEENASGLLDLPVAERGIPLEKAIALLEREVIAPGLNPASGGHLGYIPGGGIYHSSLADYLAAVTNKYASVFFVGPGAVQMENMLVRWTADLIGFGPEAGGSILSGGSIANLSALATARDAHGLLGADYAATVVYLTSQAHHSVEKALDLVGLREVQRHLVPMDEGHRMRPDALGRAIAEDRARGARPWLIVAAAGTTDAGAVDPLDQIAEVAQREGCWLHVDAAYGGFFLLTEHGRTALAGIARADSVVLDPHKGLFLPYGCGMLVARDARLLARTHGHTGHYMQDANRDVTDLSPAEVSPELTKHFRALRMWLPLVVLGVAPFRAALDEKLRLARYAAEQLKGLGFEVGPAPDLSVVTFRWAPAGVDPQGLDELNQRIVDAVRRDGRVFISSTMLDGRYTMRLAILSFRTHLRTVDLALRVLQEQVALLSNASARGLPATPD